MNLDTVTVTSGGTTINNEDTVNIVEEEDFNFTCSTSNTLVEITLTVTPDIKVPGKPNTGSSRNFSLIDVQRNLTGTVFTCTDDTNTVTFTLNVQC